MRWFKNLQVHIKLRIWAGLFFALVIGLAVGVSFNMMTILRNFDYLERYPRHRSQLAGYVNMHFMNIQQYLSRMSVYAGFPEEIVMQEQIRANIYRAVENVQGYFELLRGSFTDDAQLDETAREAYLAQLDAALRYFEFWETLVVHPVITANLTSNRIRVVELYNWHTYFFDQLIVSFSTMQEEALNAVEEGTAQVYAATYVAIVVFVALALVIAASSVSFPIMLQRMEGERASNRAKGVFLAKMSHEIRTPISVVLGISEIQLQNMTIEPHISESFGKIYHSARLLLDIVNDILDFSKLEDNKMVLLNEEYALETVINFVAGLHSSYKEKKNIDFILRVDEHLPQRLIGDSVRIEQVLINLLSNAFKYTERGVVILTWHMEGANLVICVNDTGMGMTPEQLNSIHEEYVRFHENTPSMVQGTGLGMSIVHKLLQLMNASIDIQSEPGKGTNVTVRIPQEKVGNATLGQDRAVLLQQFEAQPIHTPRFKAEPMPYGRVLVVDDIEENLYVAKGLLAFFALKVETCLSGREALEKIKTQVYDIIFMDYMMPEMNGSQAMQAMRAQGYTHPIVVLTANALAGQEQEYLADGFDAFLSKPIIMHNLTELLVRYIKDKQPPAALVAALQNASTAKEAAPLPFQDSDTMINQLRQSFYRNHRNIYKKLTEALAANDHETAHRLAHTLKGLASLIQENALSQAAAQAENELNNNQQPTPEMLTHIETELQRVLSTIIPDAPPAEAPPLAQILPLLHTLQPLLTQRDASCLKHVAALDAFPQAAIISKQIRRLQFVAALTSLNTLIEILDEYS